jgi:hypothetical protein
MVTHPLARRSAKFKLKSGINQGPCGRVEIWRGN